MEFLEIINKLKFKIETYLFKTFDIAIQKNEDKWQRLNKFYIIFVVLKI